MGRSNLKLAHVRKTLQLKTEKTRLRIRRADDQDRIAKINAELKIQSPPKSPKV